MTQPVTWSCSRPIPGRHNWAKVMAKHQRKIRQITYGPEATEWMRELDAHNVESRERAWRAQRDAEESRQ